MSVKEKVEIAIEPLLKDLGYELIEVSYQKQFNGMSLTIFIDNEQSSITLDDCEKVSKAIDPVLDELNPTDDSPYTLNVSSPGIDRPLKSDRDFAKQIGKEIELSLYKLFEGKKKHNGILVAYDEENIIIKNEKEINFLRKDIAVVKPFIKF